MIYIGKVANGTVILPPDMQLPDGTQVRIAPLVPVPHVTRCDQVTDLQEIAAGLTEDAALAALTTNPAQMLGLSDRMGSIDNGKMANLVITDKSYFNE